MRIVGLTLLILFSLNSIETEEETDTSQTFMEAAHALLAGGNDDGVGALQGVESAFMQSDAGKQVDNLFSSEKSREEGIGQIFSGLGSLLSGNKNSEGVDLNSVFNSVSSSLGQNRQPGKETDQESSINFETMLNVASMFLGQGNNAEGLMGFLPMILDSLSSTLSDDNSNHKKSKYDHSDHSWWMPPIIENLHLMWDHFSNSELGQTLWKNSGLANIVGQMTDSEGRLQYEKILDSFENPPLRRRWIKSLTNFVAEWISHIADPTTQQRYLTTIQFVGNTFLKSQGYPKSVMFEPSRPTESLSRLVNAVSKRHLNIKIDSVQYIKPAVAYVQELMSLASEKGFIVSRINARELSNRLSDSINNNLIGPLLKVYRAYKWATKLPKCAEHILCTINQQDEENNQNSRLRRQIIKFASFPAAWAISNKAGLNFWSLYGAIIESRNCAEKYPVDCSVFHEEELKVTTEYLHSEL